MLVCCGFPSSQTCYLYCVLTSKVILFFCIIRRKKLSDNNLLEQWNRCKNSALSNQ